MLLTESYKKMAFANLPARCIEQRLCTDLQIDQQTYGKEIENFMEYIYSIHPNHTDCSREEAKQKPLPDLSKLTELAKNKYERLEKAKGFSDADLLNIKAVDQYYQNREKQKETPELDLLALLYSEPADHSSVIEFSDFVVKEEVNAQDVSAGQERSLQVKREAAEIRQNQTKSVQDLISGLEANSTREQEQNEEDKEYVVPLFDTSGKITSPENLHEFSADVVFPEPPVLSSYEIQCKDSTECVVKEHLSERMYVVDSLFDYSSCMEVIEKLDFTTAEEDVQKKTQNVAHPLINVIRTNLKRTFIDIPLAEKVYSAVSQVVPKQLEDGRRFAGIRSKMNFFRYAPGQFFKTHMDGGHRFQATGETAEFTFVVYLNDDFEGGSTRFCPQPEWDEGKVPRQVSPKLGSVLIFRQRDMKHCGASIGSGSKYIIQGMVMYGPHTTNRLGRPIGKAPHIFHLTSCDC